MGYNSAYPSPWRLVEIMLITLLIWLYMLAVCWVYGQFLLNLVFKQTDFAEEPGGGALAVLAGLILLTSISSYVSLISPIGFWINLILLAVASFLLLTRRVRLPRIDKRSAFRDISLAVLALAVLIVLENATHRPDNPDTVIYHAQAIRWIESYPAVPGLGNLHGRLAFNSAWFLSNALFSFAFLGGQSFHLAGSLLFLVFLLYCWPGFQAVLRREFSHSALLKTALIPLSFALLGAEISSPGTDLPANLLIWLVAILWVEDSEKPRPFRPFFMVIFSAFAVTVKLSALPVLLLVLILFIQAWLRGDKKNLALLSASSAAIMLPFLLRNVILSGYLLYPYPAIDIFSFDWKVPAARALQERQAILAWGRLPRMNAVDVLSMSFTKWFPLWLEKQTLNRKVMLFVSLLSPLGVLPLAWFKRTSRKELPGWLVMYLGAWFWLLSAPDFRFGVGFLIPAILLGILPWLEEALSRGTKWARLFSTPALILTGVFLGLTLINSVELRSLSTRLLLPADYQRVPTQGCDLANGSIFCAKALDACSYQDFPCIPAPRPWVQMRGPDLQTGFRALP